jgi:D-alanyl-D-alanine carboxypeptidase
VSTKTVTVGQRYLRNHNKLLWQVDGADGIKTGYTKAAGRTLVSSATRDGRRLICVTLNDPDDWRDHADLLNEGFSRFSVQTIVQKGDLVGTVEVAGGQSGCVELLSGEDLSLSLAEGERVELILPGPGFVYAPVAEGAPAGVAHVMVENRKLADIHLIYGQTVETQPDEKRGLLRLFLGGNK